MAPLPDGVYVQDEHGLRRVIEGGVQDPRLSPDGSQIAFVRGGDLWVVEVVGGGEPRRLTHGAAGAGVTRGLAEYIAAEEMDRHEGFWWSPDGTMIAFAEVDERHIPVYRIVHQGKDARRRGRRAVGRPSLPVCRRRQCAGAAGRGRRGYGRDGLDERCRPADRTRAPTSTWRASSGCRRASCWRSCRTGASNTRSGCASIRARGRAGCSCTSRAGSGSTCTICSTRCRPITLRRRAGSSGPPKGAGFRHLHLYDRERPPGAQPDRGRVAGRHAGRRG